MSTQRLVAALTASKGDTLVLPADSLPLAEPRSIVASLEERPPKAIDTLAMDRLMSNAGNPLSPDGIALVRSGGRTLHEAAEHHVLTVGVTGCDAAEFHDDHASMIMASDKLVVRGVSPFAQALRDNGIDPGGKTKSGKQQSVFMAMKTHCEVVRWGLPGRPRAGKTWDSHRAGLEHSLRTATVLIGYCPNVLNIAMDRMEKVWPDRFISWGILNAPEGRNPRLPILRQFTSIGDAFWASRGFILADLINAVTDREALFALDLTRPSMFAEAAWSERAIRLVAVPSLPVPASSDSSSQCPTSAYLNVAMARRNERLLADVAAIPDREKPRAVIGLSDTAENPCNSLEAALQQAPTDGLPGTGSARRADLGVLPSLSEANTTPESHEQLVALHQLRSHLNGMPEIPLAAVS